MTLQNLGVLHGTDKAAHGYLPIYERYLAGRELRTILEIGVYSGKSLKMWRDFFPDAQIFGLDVDPGCRKFSEGNVLVATGSQDDPAALDDLIELSGGFDLVVDDGSHVNSLTMKSFEHLWPHTRQLYVIEDLGCSYVDLTPHVSKWPGMEFNNGVDYRNRRVQMDRFFARCIHRVDRNEISTIHFHRDLAVFEK